MITTSALGAQIASRLSNVQQVIPGVVRGERTDAGGHPYAIYFFALSNDLKDWADHLEQRQDEIIGPSYFETPGDLRWNHYLYLLASKEAALGDSYGDLKRAIEGDRSYARKFVLTEEDLPEALMNLERVKVDQPDVAGPDVVGRWTKRLIQAKLSVILDQRPVAETVREIAKGSVGEQPHKPDRERVPRVAQPLASKFLDAVELVLFREWPGNRLFESLGTVNLIVGSNGAGKTTLLEAIEYLYCQENARTPSPAGAHVKAKLKGAATWLETRSTAKSAEAKQRNLDWYGQRDLRGSTLPNSFSRFNFLSTDEATMLGQKNAKVSFEDLLSKLVAGPQAAELWDHISRLGQPLATERSRHQTIVNDAKQRKTNLETLIKTAAAAPRASDSDLSALVEDLSRLGWKISISRENVASEAVQALTRASSIARELITARLGIPSVSLDGIVKARDAADVTLVVIETILKQISDAEAKASSGAVARQTLGQTINDVELIKAAQQLNAFGLVAEFDRCRQQISEIRPLVGGEDLPSDVPAWMQELKEPLTSALASARRQSAVFATEVANLDSHLAALRKTQSATTSMLVEIRALTKQLLLHSPNHTNCPVCATVFTVGELGQRLEQVTSEISTDHTGSIVNASLAAREQHTLAESRRRVLTDLDAYARRRGQEQLSAFPQDVLGDYHSQRENWERLQGLYEDISLRLAGLTTAGLDYGSIKALQQTASRMEIDVFRQGAADEELARKAVELKELNTKLNQCEADRRNLISKVCLAVRGVEEVAEPIDSVVKAFRDQRTLLHNAFVLIDELQRYLALDRNSDVASIFPLLDSANASAERFAKALESESSSRANEATAKEQLAQTEKRIAEHGAAEKRIQHAIGVLSALEKEDSLLAATDAELLNVQMETDAVFRRIHSPHEYGVRRDTQAPLYRLDGANQAVTLRDVSTGQRAAFVLSVFLAMNAKLQTAPPVLLFDDPVAHIDDFNSLSFIDHLRDIALEGKRQIFYATADSRLAGLFEHKFSFMSDKFRRFDLVR